MQSLVQRIIFNHCLLFLHLVNHHRLWMRDLFKSNLSKFPPITFTKVLQSITHTHIVQNVYKISIHFWEIASNSHFLHGLQNEKLQKDFTHIKFLLSTVASKWKHIIYQAVYSSASSLWTFSICPCLTLVCLIDNIKFSKQ